MNKQCLRFEGLQGELLHMAATKPRLIRLGDGSLWQFDKTVEDWNNGKVEMHCYIPAVVEEIGWVYPSPIGATENISSIDTQSPDDKGRRLEQR